MRPDRRRDTGKERERSDVGPWLMRLSQLCLCFQMCTIVLSKDTNWESQCTADKFIPCYSAVCVCVFVTLKEHLFMLHSDRETHTDVK